MNAPGTSADGAPSRLAVYWRFTRPFTLLPPLLGMISGAITAIGAQAVHGGLSFGELLVERGRSYALFIAIGAVMAAALNAGSNVLNQWTDLENDRINKPQRPLPAGQVTIRETFVLFVALYALSLAAAAFITPLGSFESGLERGFWERHQCLAVAAAGAFFSYAYSAPPLRTKRWAWPAQVTIAIPRGGLLRIAGWTCVAGAFDDPEPWFIGAIFMLFLVGAAATKDFADMKGDAAAGCITLPVKYGPRRAAWQIAPFFVAPWLLIPLGLWLHRADLDGDGCADPLLSGHPGLLIALAAALLLYGMYILWLILRDPDSLARVENHPSWRHMYLMMMVAQVGFALAYIFAP